ncbi:glycosyltransferase family 4 protein [Pseudoxanthomonas spadix]|jgi:starch synthase|uniref:glycosyltransferase family 4 protein n=1 Tax=Pseudoxanthomonas spadix TaxID=415229 RepID=UPI000EFF022B|nr:glycosyltransferase family 4 protein [Pseudoxanthomonas spadix]MBP3974937.1 glycosyltransferase family 4 protein [Pseudoxanthomonas spadix]RMW98342.1 glycosyltransferase family 1 protein [Pseudoxanthomonas spadix]
MSAALPPPTVALFPWGEVIEEFLDPIGLSVQDFAGQMSGGWLFGYASALQLGGWAPIIVAASEQVSATTPLTHAATGTPIWIVPGRRVPAGRSAALHSLRQWRAAPLAGFEEVLRAQDCRALLIQEYEYTRFDTLVRLAARLRIPAYASFQGGERTFSWLERMVRRRSLRMCAGLVIASSTERARVEATYPAHPPIASIPNPLDCGQWQALDRQQARAQLGLPAQAFIAINHGRIDIWRKGLDVLLQAWAQSHGDQLVIIGSGQDREAFARLLAGSAPGRVRWISDYTTDRALMRCWLSAADVYLSASRIEGMPVAPLEAMACGLPVVATDAQGLPDILAGGEAAGGILVPRDDPSALAAAIERLRLDPGLRQRLGQAARRRVEHAFSVQAVARQLTSLLPQLRRV